MEGRDGWLGLEGGVVKSDRGSSKALSACWCVVVVPKTFASDYRIQDREVLEKDRGPKCWRLALVLSLPTPSPSRNGDELAKGLGRFGRIWRGRASATSPHHGCTAAIKRCGEPAGARGTRRLVRNREPGGQGAFLCSGTSIALEKENKMR